MDKKQGLFRFEPLLSLLLIIVIAALAYLPLAGQLGICCDAWHIIRTAESIGVDALPDLFTSDRPAVGWLYWFNYQVQGDSLTTWSVFTLMYRLLGVICFWWILRMLWPRRRLATTLMALLFTVYPGFLKMPDAITYQVMMIVLAVALLSIALSLKAYQVSSRGTRILLLAVSALMGVGYLLTVEFFLGLEGLRFLLLWYQRYQAHRGEKFVRQSVQALARFSLFLAVDVIYLIWRLFFFQSRRVATDTGLLFAQYRDTPVLLLKSLAGWFQDVFSVTVGGWVVPLAGFLAGSGLLDLFFSVLLGAVAAGLFVAFARWLERSTPLKEREDLQEDPACAGMFLC